MRDGTMKLVLVALVLVGCQRELGGWKRVEGLTYAEMGYANATPGDGPYFDRVVGVSPTEVWALTDASTRTGTVVRWDGTSWKVMAVVAEASDLALVDGVPWLTAGASMYRWDGASFSHFETPSLKERYILEKVWGALPDIWVQSFSIEDSLDGRFREGALHWDGQRWHEEPRMPTWGAAPDDAWAVQAGSLFHWDGATWAEHPASGVNAVWGLSSNEVWAVGDGELLMRWDGSSWTTLSDRRPCSYSSCATFAGLWGTDANDLWLVGTSGPGWGSSGYGAIQHWDGRGLTKYLGYAEWPARWNEARLGMLREVFGFPNGVTWATGWDVLLRYEP